MLRAYKTPIFAKGQQLTHSPAHEEKHAGQETPLHYTPYLQWHHPGGRALLQLAQAPTQDYHSYTHALLGVVGGQVVTRKFYRNVLLMHNWILLRCVVLEKF